MTSASPYYSAVEKYLADNKIQFNPKLVDFVGIEEEARLALAHNLNT